MIGQTLSHFRIVDRLGEGGMGIVYKAEDTELQRTVALKVLQPEHVGDEERRARFVREAQTAARVTHPNIATIYEVGEADGNIFIAMELVSGKTLRTRLGDSPISTADAIELAIQVADGMAKAHQAEVIHRDLKPDNIIIDEDGRAKVLDFGLAKAFEPGETDGEDATVTALLTREGRILGTAAYMSPEQARAKDLDARSDIFSLGIILYEMMTGRRPFEGETTTDILASILREEPTPPLQLNPQIPPEMARIIAKCLEKSPSERYQDSRDLVVDLRRMLRDPATQSIISDPSLISDPARLASLQSGEPVPAPTPPEGHPSYPSVPSIPGVPAIADEKEPRFIGIFQAGYWAVALVALAIVAVVFLQNRGPEVALANNNLAVMMFQNLKDPADSDRLGQILQELVITELSDMPELTVYSAQRLFDVHQQLSGSDKPIYDPEVATEVAVQAGAGSMIQGHLSQLDDMWILTAQLVDVATGTIQTSQRIDGTNLYEMVDELGDALREDLGQSIETFAEAGSDDSLWRKRDGATASGTTAPLTQSGNTEASLAAYRTYLVGNELLEQQQFHMAADTLKKAVELDPTFGQAYYKLAMALWWPGDNYAGAGQVLEELLSKKLYSTRKERLLAEAALELIKGDDKARAIALYTQITDQYPDDKDGWYGFGEALFHNSPRMEGQALQAFRKATQLDPGFGLAYRHILDIQWDNGRYEESIAEIQPFIQAHPTSALAHEYWIGAASRWGNPEEIEKALASARKAEMDDKDHHQMVLIQAARGSMERGDVNRATELLTEARRVDPEGVGLDWYQGMGQALWRLGDVEGLHRLVEETVVRFPDKPRTGQEGEILVALEQRDAGRVSELSQQLLEETPGDIQPRIYLSASAAMESDWEELEEIVEETMSSELDMAAKRVYLRELGETLTELRYFDRARIYVDQAVQLSEDEPEDRIRNVQAWLDAQSGRLNEAEAFFREEIEAGNAIRGKAGLMYVALRRGDYEGAAAIGHDLIDSGSETSELMRAMALALNALGRYEEALPYAERSAAMERTYPAQTLLAWTLIAGEIDIDRGLRVASTVAGRRLRPSEARWHFPEFPSPEHAVGLALMKKGMYEAAADALEGAQELRPDRKAIAEDLRRAEEAL